ncbi:hypothetical protein CWI75_16695 [Kineobactrum sediminis]|uniref:Secreted protein n=1 Tax=Kineobactrum sediminis TaxID=1905677 RepID=A0A2N5XYP1_9GAMM|nr:hypothetical protein [Kineobactrum sediminis]PLW81264.1 hypothetical protein CWI75_16695 [Kineobactrum sediminis]
MPFKARANLVFALFATILVSCGGDLPADSADEGGSSKASKGCTERDGGWFGRNESGAMIISQTQEACEERLGK